MLQTELINEELEKQIQALSNLDAGSDEYSAQLNVVTKLSELVINNAKAEVSISSDVDKTTIEQEKLKETKRNNIINHFIQIGGIVVPAVCYFALIIIGYGFEQEDTPTSVNLRNVMGKLKPTK